MIEEPKKQSLELRKRLTAALQTMLPLTLVFFTLLIIIRIYEYIYVSVAHGAPKGGLMFEFRGLGYDLMLTLVFSGIVMIPFIVLHIFRPKIARIFYVVMMVIVDLCEIGLVGYFTNTLVPLGSDLFGYSKEEIQHTVGASGAVNFLSILPFFIFAALAIFMGLRIRNIRTSGLVLFLFFMASAGSLFFTGKLVADNRDYNSEMGYYLTNNKLSYFAVKTYDYFFPELSDDLYNEFYIADDEDTTAGKGFQFKYVSNSYPLLHEENTPDVLGAYFKTSNDRPNLVFIVVESLGRGYSGPDAPQGSFTPFLDSLKDHSLYWENFLSSAGRTFGFLPSIFGSCPFGDKGFLDLGAGMPIHNSMIHILKQNGYYTSFYYGGDAHFDNMDVFLRRNTIDRIIQENDYGAGYAKLPANSGGFTWGYGDKELFRKMLEVNSADVGKPRLDIFMTVANHSPFMVQNQQYYLKLFEHRMKEMNISEDQKNEFRKYSKNYSCILYTDDAIRGFINAYKKRSDFDKTIFVITGDHRMPEIPILTKIDRFHVPFIVYSPMLKRTAKFTSISTHLDVTPSFLAFMKYNYKCNLPRYSSWVSYGIDTFHNFRNVHSIPLMRNKNELVDYLDRDFFLAENQLYKISDKLDIEPITDDQKQKEIEGKFADYKNKNHIACFQNKLYPDSLLPLPLRVQPIAQKIEKKKK